MSVTSKTGLLTALLDIIFPERCLGCSEVLRQRRKISYCPACRQDVRLLQEPFCSKCCKPFDGAAGKNHLCGYCLKNTWHFNQVRAAVHYRPAVAEAVKMFKYRGKMHGLSTFAALSRRYLQLQPLSPPDLILPVPLHVKRLRQRGFNQSLLLCRKIFPEYRDRIAPHILERRIWTQPQTGLSGTERRRNVRNAFRVCVPEKIQGKRILLVDDVFTTGATVNECARVLLQNRASGVDVFTFARALQ
jgi:ComF family protein